MLERHRVLSALFGAVIALYLRAIRPTLRVRRIGAPTRRPNDGGPTVYASLHGDQSLLASVHRGGFAPLISRSRDGSWAAVAARLLGHPPLRGSTRRGGVAGLLGLRAAVAGGRSPVLAVDGPRGPRGRVHGGAVVLARRCRVPLVPVVAASAPSLELPTWDAHRVPLPFARIVVLYGRRRPQFDSRGDAMADLEAALVRLSDRLR